MAADSAAASFPAPGTPSPLQVHIVKRVWFDKSRIGTFQNSSSLRRPSVQTSFDRNFKFVDRRPYPLNCSGSVRRQTRIQRPRIHIHTYTVTETGTWISCARYQGEGADLYYPCNHIHVHVYVHSGQWRVSGFPFYLRSPLLSHHLVSLSLLLSPSFLCTDVGSPYAATADPGLPAQPAIVDTKGEGCVRVGTMPCPPHPGGGLKTTSCCLLYTSPSPRD